MRELQEFDYGAGHDYETGSPHLRHRSLREAIVGELRAAADHVRDRGLPSRWLDVGSGHGSVVEPLLAWGFDVTATEMSAPSLAHLRRWYGGNERFRARQIDDDGPVAPSGETYSAISCISVLHHIPDYLAAIDTLVSDHLVEGGCFVSFQDPMWYPAVGRGTRVATWAAYYAWRMGQGNYGRAISTFGRRVRGVLDEENPADMVEYHVVRSGVNQRAILDALEGRFEDVALLPYWSTQGRLWQRLGARTPMRNYFGIVACGRLPAAS